MPTEQEALERLKFQLQSELEEYKAKSTASLEAFKVSFALRQSQMTTGTAYATIGLRSLLLVNGGGIVGILTFIGNLWAKDVAAAQDLAHAASHSVSSFVIGLLLALIALFTSYISQVIFIERDEKKSGWPGHLFRMAALLACLASFGFFAYGALSAAQAFGRH
jgi:hypothetical protein